MIQKKGRLSRPDLENFDKNLIKQYSKRHHLLEIRLFYSKIYLLENVPSFDYNLIVKNTCKKL